MNKKPLVAFFALLFLFLAPSQANLFETLRQKLLEINNRIFHVKKQLTTTKKREKHAITKLIETERRLGKTEKELEMNKRRLSYLQNNIQQLNLQIAREEKRLAQHHQQLNRRLVEFYKQGGRGGFLAVLLGVTDSFSLLARPYYLQKILREDKALFDAIKQEKEELARRKAQLEKEKRVALELKQQQEEAKRRIEEERRQRLALLRDIQSKRIEYERALEELERNSREIEAMLLAMEQTPEGQKRLKTPWKGNFITPVRGRLTSRFGMRVHPIYHIRKMHTGIDLSAPSGTPIKAVAGGTVVFSGWWGGYGKVVIIDHGGGISTLYGHCSALYVSKGQYVKQGQVIAEVGSTGLSTGPHLHFEVRKNGKPVDPLAFLK